jgi:hypothetical protein
MAASLSDILTGIQNITVAINNMVGVYLNVVGHNNTTDMTAATLVSNTNGRVCQCVVTVTSSTTGAIYDSLNASSSSRKIFTIPATVGSYTVNMPVAYGIVVSPGSGQTVSISWS